MGGRLRDSETKCFLLAAILAFTPFPLRRPLLMESPALTVVMVVAVITLLGFAAVAIAVYCRQGHTVESPASVVPHHSFIAATPPPSTLADERRQKMMAIFKLRSDVGSEATDGSDVDALSSVQCVMDSDTFL
ncbi:unnamed protein product [Aphanomyces euteiches]